MNLNNQTDHKEFYSVSDLLKLLPVGRNAIYKLVNETDFPKIKIGSRIVIPSQQFWAYIDQKL
ncbi:helix-turn-helix domain-containing protein [Paenibacillus sp. 2003]|uniref:helix-turn-helix transcriptional regulator n=1 Tax=Paenibacillus sp. 2003 TaxID=2817761 RepID=UPI0028630C46|nr:helix-turn-helix domain-containing protein [Paenibacillus sp. 2003]MDR6720883.1 putative DNA-binding transcriptional regulator AlpA [Paenibacillus sp. 2003]